MSSPTYAHKITSLKDCLCQRCYNLATWCQRRDKTTAVSPVLLLEVRAIGEDAVPTLQ
jgi:hypothetical protein